LQYYLIINLYITFRLEESNEDLKQRAKIILETEKILKEILRKGKPRFFEDCLENQYTIITFKYDVFIETVIEIASGKNPPHEYLKIFQSDITNKIICVFSKKSE
jgi:hypothetical protein